MRRLPIYFLVDISGASDINKLNMCLLKILLYIREDPYINSSLKFEITAKRLYAASQRVL